MNRRSMLHIQQRLCDGSLSASFAAFLCVLCGERAWVWTSKSQSS